MTDATVAGALGAVTVAAPAPVDAGQTVYLHGVLSSIGVACFAGGVDAYSVDRSGNVIGLTLLDTSVPNQPGTLRVTVGNGPAGGTAYFFLDGSTSSFYSVGLDGTGSAVGVGLPINGLTMAAHVVRVGSGSSSPESTSAQNFAVLEAPATDSTPTPAYPPAVTTGRWTFQAYNWVDPLAIPTYQFAMNPSKITESYGDVSLTSERTTAANGITVLWEGVVRPSQWSWSGRVFTKYDHDALVWWNAYNGRVWLTDEYGRSFLIKIESLDMKRKRNIDQAWDHEYTMVASVLASYVSGYESSYGSGY
jgi:hypothetical protein